jgi:hypothetical protein
VSIGRSAVPGTDLGTDSLVHAEQQAIVEEVEMVLGPDWREDFTYVRWISTPEGRPVLEADALVMFGFMDDGKFAAMQRTGLNEATIIVGTADHCWHKTAQMSPKEREGWDRSLADYGLSITPARRTGPRVLDRPERTPRHQDHPSRYVGW